MASVWEHIFICTLSSLQRDRNAHECSHNRAVWATGSSIPAPRTRGRTVIFRDCTSHLLEHYYSWLSSLSHQAFVSNLALLFPTLGKGREENLCGETESKQMESAGGPRTPRGPLLSHRNSSSSQEKARTGSGRKGSSKSMMRCAQAVHGHAWTAAVLIARSHVSYEMSHGLISHTLSTNMIAFSELFICKNRNQTFAVSEENEVCLTFCSY